WDRDPDDVLAGRAGHTPGGSRDRGRLGTGRRRLGMPEQGASVAHRSRRRPADLSLVSTGPFAAVIERDLVVVRGPDATSFLQSLVSQDLDAVPVGASAHALLLQPQGKLIVDFNTLHRGDDEWWCVVESGFGAALADGLNRFKIRVKVEIEMRALSVFAVRDQVPPDDTHGADVVGVSWNGRPAYDALAFDARAVNELRNAIDVPVVSTAEYERARIE